MDTSNWRFQLQPASRQRMVNRIVITLKRHLPFFGHEGLQELNKIAVRFEERIFTSATSPVDYLQKISLKMQTMEARSQNPMPDAQDMVYVKNIKARPKTMRLNPFAMAQHLNNFHLLQTISLVYTLVTVTCTGSSLSHDEECSALFQFKQSIIYQDDAACAMSGFQTFDSWKPTTNASNTHFECCAWDGVVCSNNDEYGRVIGLDLSESFICGHINSSSTLFRLVHLQRLNLAMNDFYESQIPSEIAHLKQLRVLNLSGSWFSGQIPNEISQLVQLSSLDLSLNPLKLQRPGLMNLVQNLTSLEELHLSRVDISSPVPHFLANFSSLRSIMLDDCLLQSEFPSAIFELPKLKILNVASNTDLTGSFPEFHNESLLEYVILASTGFFGTVPQTISNLNHLKLLILSECYFSGRIPSSLSNMTQLTNLGLGSNNFTGLVPSLVRLSELNALQLDGNKFEKGRLPNWIGKLTKLEELILDNMNINGEIPTFLANLTQISVLSMGYNSLIGHVPSSFFNLTQLTQLVLYKNQLQGPISHLFSNFRSLELLFLQYNDFSGRVDLDVFLGLNKLQNLNVGYNRISIVPTNNYTNSTLPDLQVLGLQSCNLKKFPAFLRFQNRMLGLFFNHNIIDGLVPVWIWNNSRETLNVINLSNNSITGCHQNPRFLPWEDLEGFFINDNQVQGRLPIPPQTTIYYDASDNNLTGEIPPVICEVKSLRLLDLSSNSMRGTLPPCFGSLSNSLLVLNLRGNNFHGVMMKGFMHGSLLQSIDLSENRFMGPLPRSLANCTNLEVLSLGENSFNDVFPSWLGTLAKLQVLVLRSNNFYGPIQGSISVYSHFPKMRIVDISNNGFRGRLDQNYFQTWNAMKTFYDSKSSVMESAISSASGSFHTNSLYSMTLIHKGVRTEYKKILTIFTAIDISCNHFEGEIPLSLQDLQGLESLNLSNNYFTGRILPSLGYLKNLESLDLSKNELSGEIPQQLVQLGFLAIFNVSFNQLDGRIPQGKQFNTFDNNSYEGNPQLCGKPLWKECQDSKVSRLPPASASNMSVSLLPSEIVDWIVIFCGVGSGLVIGIVIGNFLRTKYID